MNAQFKKGLYVVKSISGWDLWFLLWCGALPSFYFFLSLLLFARLPVFHWLEHEVASVLIMSVAFGYLLIFTLILAKRWRESRYR